MTSVKDLPFGGFATATNEAIQAAVAVQTAAALVQRKPAAPVNLSGIQPVEYKVLVLIEETEKVTKGGIILTTDHKERADMAQVKGVLVAVGGNAFSDWSGNIPAVGNRVMIAKYSGLVAEGDDGKMYRLCSDKDIAAVLA